MERQVGVCIMKFKSTQNSWKDSSQHAMSSFSCTFCFIYWDTSLQADGVDAESTLSKLWALCTQPSACEFCPALMGGTLGSLLGNWHKGQSTLVTQSSVNRAKHWLTGLWERMLPPPVPAVSAHASSSSSGCESTCFLFQSFQKDLKYSATLFKCLFFGLKYKSAITCHRPSNGRTDIGRVHMKHARSSGFDPQHKRAKWRPCSRSFSKNFRVVERNIHLLLFYLC